MIGAWGGENLSCPQCGRVYKSKYTLKRHLQYECGKEPQFTCQICRAKFKQKHHLKNHMATIHHQQM